MKAKMTKVGAVVAAAIYFSFGYAKAAMVGFFSFGLVNLTWPLIGSLVAAMKGYKTNAAVFLAAGLLSAYYQAFVLSI